MLNPRQDRYAPGERLEVAGCAVRLRVDGRARRISLRVDAASREVVATAHSHAQWIKPGPRETADGIALPESAKIEL